MKLQLSQLLLASVFLILLTSSCKKDHNTTIPAVYLAGVYTPEGKNLAAAYWKNDQFYPLEDGSKTSYANDILVENGTVYVVGDYDGYPCIWINGDRFFTNNFQSSKGYITAITRFSNGIFTTGYFYSGLYSHAFLALSNAPLFTESASVNSFGVETVFDNDYSYIAGLKAGQAGYWGANGRTDLGKSTDVSGIEVKNGIVYLASTFDKDNNNIFDAGYWKGDVFVSLGLANVTQIYDVKSSPNGTLLLAGSVKDNLSIAHATIWEDNLPKSLSDKKSSATDIAFSGSTPFISGRADNVACYWLNGKMISLKTPNSVATSIYIE